MKLIDRLRGKLTAAEFAELCEAIRELDASFFRDATLDNMKPVKIDWNDVPDGNSPVTSIEMGHAYREMAEEDRAQWLVRSVRDSIVKRIPSNLRRWVLLQVIADPDV